MAAAAMRNFNTLKYFERFKKVGVSEDQAREFVGMMEDSINDNMRDLVTKEFLKAELQAELAPIRTDIAVLKAGMALMQRLFFGSTLIILLAIAGLYLHA